MQDTRTCKQPFTSVPVLQLQLLPSPATPQQQEVLWFVGLRLSVAKSVAVKMIIITAFTSSPSLVAAAAPSNEGDLGYATRNELHIVKPLHIYESHQRSESHTPHRHHKLVQYSHTILAIKCGHHITRKSDMIH
jgi:hypothetical protein